jgi:hypothetical protein
MPTWFHRGELPVASSDIRTARNALNDRTPSALSAFTTQTNVAEESERISNEITVAGINRATLLTVSNGKYSINGSNWIDTPTHVHLGDKVRLRHIASSSPNTSVVTTLTIGGVQGTFTSTTAA